MKTRFLISIILIILGAKIYSQDKFKVISSTFLKLNPDEYADNILQIPQDATVTKVSNADTPFILVNFNAEIGYVNKIYLLPFYANSEGSLESLEEKSNFLKFEEVAKIKMDTENDEKKISVTSTNSISSIKWDNNYFWGFIVIPILFLVFFAQKMFKSARKKYKIDLSKKTDN
jgi:hypothetical protein